MRWLVLTLCCVACVELFLRLGIVTRVRRMHVLALKSSRVITSRHISDHWKEIVLPHYAFDLFAASIRMFITFITVLSPFILIVLVAPGFDDTFIDLLISAEGIAASCVISLAYIKAKSLI